jgi:hypothetical protein
MQAEFQVLFVKTRLRESIEGSLRKRRGKSTAQSGAPVGVEVSSSGLEPHLSGNCR